MHFSHCLGRTRIAHWLAFAVICLTFGCLGNGARAQTFRSIPVISAVGRIALVIHNDYEVLRTNIVHAPAGRSFIMFDMDTPYFPIHNLGKE